MKLYYAAGACSLADRIMLHEAGLDAGFERVDLKTKRTETGADFTRLNPKGYVPLLVLDGGEVISENLAILSWITDQAPELAPPGALGRIRLLEALSYIAAEVHHAYKPFFHDGDESDKARAREVVTRKLSILASALKGPYLFGDRFTAADAYLFVTLRWARAFGVAIPEPLPGYFDRVMARSAVRAALVEEGLELTPTK